MRKFIVTAAVAFSFGITASASATSVPPVEGAIPATPVTTTTVTPGPTTTTITASKTTELIRNFEKRTRRKVVFYWKEKGISSKGSTDPVRKRWIKVGQKFSNTYKDARGRTVRVWGKWRKGDKLVNVRRGKDKYGSFIEGTIVRCGNERVRIYTNLKKIRKKKIKKVSEWVSKEKFIEKNAENTSTSSSSTTVHTTVYTCPDGYDLNGSWCYPRRKDGTQTPAPPPTSAPGANPAPADTIAAKCYSEVSGKPVNPTKDGRCPVGSYGA